MQSFERRFAGSAEQKDAQPSSEDTSVSHLNALIVRTSSFRVPMFRNRRWKNSWKISSDKRRRLLKIRPWTCRTFSNVWVLRSVTSLIIVTNTWKRVTRSSVIWPDHLQLKKFKPVFVAEWNISLLRWTKRDYVRSSGWKPVLNIGPSTEKSERNSVNKKPNGSIHGERAFIGARIKIKRRTRTLRAMRRSPFQWNRSVRWENGWWKLFDLEDNLLSSLETCISKAIRD